MPWQRGADVFRVLAMAPSKLVEDPPYFDVSKGGEIAYGDFTSIFNGPAQFLGPLISAGGKPWVDALAFDGIDPTGKTVCTAACQSAINAAQGGVVLFPPGQYLTQDLTFPTLTVMLAWGTTFLAAPGTTSVLSLLPSGNNQGWVFGLSILGNGNLPANGLLFEDNATGYSFNFFRASQCVNGIANVNHAYSCEFNRGVVSGNQVGVNWKALGQNTAWRGSQIVGNTQNQVLIGDGTTAVGGPLKFDFCQINPGSAVAQSSVIVKTCDQLLFTDCDFEPATTAAALDIEFAASNSRCVIRGNRANGNSATNYSIQIDSGVSGTTLLMEGTNSFSYLTGVTNNLGTSSNIRKLAVLENGTFISDNLNGTNLTWP